MTVASVVGCGDDGRGEETATPMTTTGVTTMNQTTTLGTTTDATTDGSTGTTAESTSTTTGTTAEPTTGEPTTGPASSTGADPVCGDGSVDAGEECDDGPDNGDGKTCTAACKTNVCGDGLLLEGVEACDAGPDNGEDKMCTPECTVAVCGDGFVLATEGCDDGNVADGDGCSATCTPESCGDGVVQAPEECDDGNQVLTDACLSNCVKAACGDGVVFAGTEVCDDGNADETDTCTSKCAAPACDDMLKSGKETDVDCGGPACAAKCALDQGCAVNSDCDTLVCKDNKCAPGPKTCKEVLANDPMAKSGLHKLDLDGNPMTPPIDAYCDMTTNGGGWTVFYAATGADNQQPMTSNTEDLAGNPLSFQYYNWSRAKKVQLGALSTETLFFRNNNTWLRASAPAFNDKLTMNNQTHKVGVMLLANNGAMGNGFMGFTNFGTQGGGDFGVTLAPDALTCGQFMTMTGFDHHGLNYRMLNCGCERHYLYSYSGATNDGDAGYDSLLTLGSWTPSQANCGAAAAEGGALIFYAAMR